MTATEIPPAPVRRRRLTRLVAQGVIAAVGLAIGACAGLVGAFWFGLIEISC